LVYDDLFPECFVLKENADIYLSIQTLHKSGTPIDLITVSNELKKQGLYDSIGAGYLAHLSDDVYTSANIEAHTRILLERYVDREIENIGRNKSKDPLENFDNVKKKIEALEGKIGKKTNTQHISNALKKSLEEMEARIRNFQQGVCVGIPTGFRDLDKHINGFNNSRLYILAARPGMGKTSIALYFAQVAAMDGKSVMFFSLEMSEKELSDKLILSMCNVDKSRFDGGFIDKREANEAADAARQIAKWKLHIDDTAGISMMSIKSKAKEYKEMGLCDIVFIDYLQLCEEKGIKGRTREQEVSAMSREAKIISRELNVPVILLSQLSRKVEERKGNEPQLSDLRDSGAIEQDADCVIFIYRENYYDNQTKNNYGEFFIEKNRQGRCTKVPFQHNDEFSQFYNYGTY
jgi:replicative DNA helicase